MLNNIWKKRIKSDSKSTKKKLLTNLGPGKLYRIVVKSLTNHNILIIMNILTIKRAVCDNYMYKVRAFVVIKNSDVSVVP